MPDLPGSTAGPLHLLWRRARGDLLTYFAYFLYFREFCAAVQGRPETPTGGLPGGRV